MSAACGLADLARVFAALGPERDAAIADWLGFRPQRVIEAEVNARAGPATASIKAETPAAAPLAPIPFWRVVRVEQREPIAAPKRPPALSEGELSAFEQPTAPPPRSPLATERHLATALRRLLATPKPTRTADLRTLVHRLARAELVAHVPRRRRAKMPERVVVIADRRRRLIPLWDDQVDVVRVLERALSRGGVRSLVVHGSPLDARALRELDEVVRWGGGPPAPLLALTDLGALTDGDAAAAWRQLGRAVQRAGSLACALTPCPARAVASRSGWRVASWESGPESSSDARWHGAHRLLRMASVAVFAEPALLRDLRRLLPRREVDVRSELELWSHSAVRGEQYQGLELRDLAERDRLRREFADQEPAELQRQVVEVIKAHHADALRDIWFEELVTLAPLLADAVAPTSDLHAARQYFERFAATLSPRNTDERARSALLAYFRRFERRAPKELWDDPQLAAPLLDAWQLAHLGDASAAPPRSVDPARIADLVGSNAVADMALHQRGDRLVLAPHTPASAPPMRASPMHTIVRVGDAGASLSSAATRASFHDGESPTSAPSIGERVTITSEASVVELEALTRPTWATAMGRDKFGLWAEFEVKGVKSRMRWIPPGTFVMGASPAEKEWAWTDETAHEVRLTRGFWLGETPVTQALWEAVMGRNPSRFWSADRPVERVSWDTCAKFHTRLNDLVPAFGARFPTEAEWEYACRAGTTTSTYAGDLEVLGANNALILDHIAWYGGNSGVDANFPNGEDSSKWPEKQHEHEHAASHPVRAKLPNDFGLYDMLGNVYEWCVDWLGDYPTGAVIDPVGRRSGGDGRVLRGGSWDSRARDVRAAYRRSAHPSLSIDYFGVRLARGPSELPGAERGGDEAEPRRAASKRAARGRGTRPGERSPRRRPTKGNNAE